MVLTIYPYKFLSSSTVNCNTNLVTSNIGIIQITNTCKQYNFDLPTWIGDTSDPYFLYIQSWIVPASKRKLNKTTVDTVSIKHWETPWSSQISQILVFPGQKDMFFGTMFCSMSKLIEVESSLKSLRILTSMFFFMLSSDMATKVHQNSFIKLLRYYF